MTEIVKQSLSQSSIVAEKRMQQQRLEKFYYDKKRIQEHNNKKVQLDKSLLEAYYARLDALALYTRNAKLQAAQADQGKLLDIEIK